MEKHTPGSDPGQERKQFDEAEVASEALQAKIYEIREMGENAPADKNDKKGRNIASPENPIAKSRPVVYWAIDVEIHSARALYEHPCVKAFIESTTMTLKDELHVTIIFIGGANNLILDEETKTLQHACASNMVIPLQLEFLVIDERCAAIDVSILNPALRNLVRNKHPHMTFGLAKGTKPVYSNQMLARCVGDPPAMGHISPTHRYGAHRPPKRFELEGLILNGCVRAHY